MSYKSVVRAWYAVFAGIIVCGSSATAAWAEEAIEEDSSASAPSSTSSNQNATADSLAEIVVTAQRRSENLDKVPISLTAFSPKAMDDLHIQGLDDLAALVPGLVISTIGGNTQSSSDIAIRGIFSGGNAPTTGIYIDETPIAIRRQDVAGFSGSPRPDVFDLDRIEVLRGPQGTLFGAGAMGGAIRYITPQPDLHQASGYAKAEASFTDEGSPGYDAGVAYGAPIVEGVAAFRASGWFRSSGGFIDEVNPYSGSLIHSNANSSNSYVLRPAISVAPTEHLTITPAAFIQHHHSDASDQYWTDSLWSTSGFRIGTDKNLSGMGRGPTWSTDDLKIYGMDVKYDLPTLSIQSDTSYLDRQSHAFDDWTSVIPFFLGARTLIIPGLDAYTPYDEDIEQSRMWQQELRISSTGTSRFSWVAGAYYRREVTVTTQTISDVNPATEALYDVSAEDLFNGVPEYEYNGQLLSSFSSFSTVDEQKALFGEVTLGITDSLKANVGVRIEHSTVEQQHEIYAGSFSGVSYGTATVPDEVDNPVTPRAGLTYQFGESGMVYATAAKGYRSGGSNAAAVADNVTCDPSVNTLGFKAVPQSYSSDSLWSYELGSKISLFERRISVQSSVFYIDWTKIQSPIGLPSCGSQFTLNAGKAISQGFDFQIAAVPVSGLHLNANIGYVDAYFPQALLSAPNSNGTIPIIHAAGEKVGGVIPWTASAQAEYSHAINSFFAQSRAYVRVDYRWLDRIANGSPVDAGTDTTLGAVLSDAYSVLNLRLGITQEGLDASIYAENLTNSDPRLGYSHYGAYSATAIRPLTAGLSLLYRF